MKHSYLIHPRLRPIQFPSRAPETGRVFYFWDQFSYSPGTSGLRP